MTVFSRYAEYYDLAYADKNYRAEAEFVSRKLGLQVSPGAQLLELGCGTGRHAVEFSTQGWEVHGIDLSEDMVRIARDRVSKECQPALAKRISVGDVRSVDLGMKFDAVVSLFHVFSYQTSNADLQGAFATASRHLAPRGRLLFDFWYGPAVLSDPPQVRVRRMRSEHIAVTRIAEPVWHENDNVVDVRYELIFEGGEESEAMQRVEEVHRMRYLFMPEILDLLERNGLRCVDSGRWLSEDPLGRSAWNGWVVAEHAI